MYAFNLIPFGGKPEITSNIISGHHVQEPNHYPPYDHVSLGLQYSHSPLNDPSCMRQGSSSVSAYMDPKDYRGNLSHLPSGYIFFPKDDELILDYLMKKVSNQLLPCNVVFDVDLYKINPWDITDKPGEENKCYFFTHRDRRYPNGTRPNRVAKDGYWKASAAGKTIRYSRPTPYYDQVYGNISYNDIIGTKRSLVFYSGKSPKGTKTRWIMHEYNLHDNHPRPNNKDSPENTRLDGWVLCSIYYNAKAPKG